MSESEWCEYPSSPCVLKSHNNMSDTPETDAMTDKRKFLKRVAELMLAIELYVDKLESERDELAAKLDAANERLAELGLPIKKINVPPSLKRNGID